MRIAVDSAAGTPVGTQLVSLLRGAIERGELDAGERLPSLREAARAAGVHVNTVRSAYAKLESEGLVTTEQGRGTFVVDRARAESERRRALHDEIARLEAELITLPRLSRAVQPSTGRRRSTSARLLGVDELAAVRDVLADHVAEIRAARAAVARDEADRRTAGSAARAPSRRSSSSVAGVRVRWTSA